MSESPIPDVRLHLNLFGGPSLLRDGTRVSLSPFQEVLLGILAVHGLRGIARDQLFGFLWNVGTDAQLRRRLNQLVYSLNRRFGGERVVALTGANYALDVDRIRSDLEDFLFALSDRSPASAVAIAVRGFMSQLEGPPTADLERWIRERDLRFRSDVRTLAAERWSEAEQRGDWAMAEEAAVAMITLAPEDESALRRLLQAKALLGRVREAEAAYEGFRDLARVREPQWEPCEETSAILARMDELVARGRDVVVLRASPTIDEPPLIARYDELEALSARVRNPPQDAVHVLVVSGESGIGKTRLIREALARAPFDGVRVLEGRCSEFERNIPLSPLLQALSQDWIGREVRAVSAPWSQLLHALLPEFNPADGGVDGGYQGAPEEVPRATCEAILRLLRRLADPDPFVLFLDDFQWLDETSLTVLEYVRDRWTDGGFLLVVAVRPDEMDRGPLVSRWLEQPRPTGSRPPERLHLGPLEPRYIAELIHGALSMQNSEEELAVDEDRIIHMVAQVGGNPLLALQYARHFADPSQSPSADPDRLGVPGAVREVVRRRTARLADETRGLLATLSPSDKPLSHSALERAFGFPGTAFATAIDEAVQQDLLAISPRGIEFRHGLLREAVYEELSEGKRIAAHRRIADALIELAIPGVEVDISLHLLAAGEGGRAIPHVMTAARLAIDSGGWSEARSLLERALAANPQAQDRDALTALLGKLLLLEGDFSEAEVLWARAEAAHSEAKALEPELLCRLRRIEASFLHPDPDRGLLLDRIRELRAQAERNGLQRIVAESMGLEVAMLDRLERVADVRDLAAEAARVDGAGDVDARLQFLLVSMVDAVYGDPERAATLADEAIELASRHGMAESLLRAVNWKVIAFGLQARLNLSEAQSVVNQARKLVSCPGDVTGRFRIIVNLGVWYLDAGDRSAAEQALQIAEKLLTGASAPHLRRTLAGNLGQLALESGESGSAVEHFSNCINPGLVSDWGSHRLSAMAGLGLAYLHEGRLTQAREVQRELPEKPDHWTFDPFLWLSFDARLSFLSGTPIRQVLDVLAAHETSLGGWRLTSWMRLRLLRFELGLRRGITPDRGEVEELEEFLSERRIPHRLGELRALLKRYGNRS